jgi:ABC-2 type transport system ATP-binding protein
VKALEGVNVTLLRGRILGVVGLNGSGKSTLLRILAGDLAADCGDVDRRGCGRADIAFVPQRPEPWAGRLEEHLHLHAAYYGHTGKRNNDLVKQTIAVLDLGRFHSSRYAELSAGYQIRCALARALVSIPRILILDEPLASLDPVAQYRFLANLYAHARHTRRLLPIIISSQHIDAIESFADDILVLQDGRSIFCDSTVQLGRNREENVFVETWNASNLH